MLNLWMIIYIDWYKLLWGVSGIARRALTANKWSRRLV